MDAFAIKSPNGVLMAGTTLAFSETDAWDFFREKFGDYEEKQGYTCVRVQITEGWIPVGERLPGKDEWVQVLEDDNDNPQDAFIGNMLNTFRYGAKPARLLSVDAEGNAYWFLCYVGSSPIYHVRNVTHWAPMMQPLPPPPKEKK